MIGIILNIWRKELMDYLRDRKSLTQSLATPLILGIFYALFNPLISSSFGERARAPVSVPTVGIEYAGDALLKTFDSFGITLTPYVGDLRAAIERAEEGAGLIIPPGFADAVTGEQPASLTLLTNPTAGGLFGGTFSSERLDLAINAFNQQVAAARVQARSVSPDLLKPVSIQPENLATPSQLGGAFASFSLPLLLAIVVAQGGLYIAIDVTAGEKERGTLEALFVTPVSDVQVLVGKLLAVFTMTVVPLVLTFAGFWVATALLPESVRMGTLPLNVIISAVLIGLPLSLFLNVVTMILCVRAKAFKDAQNAATPVIFGAMIPAFAAAFAQPASALAYLIPVYGSSAVIGKLAAGGVLPENAVLFAVLGSLIAAAAGFGLALRLFNRERVLYKA